MFAGSGGISHKSSAASALRYYHLLQRRRSGKRPIRSSKTYKCADCIPQTADSAYTDTFTTEYLNALEFFGILLHEAVLKAGAPVILMRNLDPINGLCNATKLLIMKLGHRILEAKIITGDKR
jgi:hypothetical protein